MDIIHSDLKPVRATHLSHQLLLTILQTNVLIDRNFHPRLTDYGLITIMSDPNTINPSSTAAPSIGTVRYMAPELLNLSGFGLMNSIPPKISDIYAFGVVTYQVSFTCFISGTATEGSAQVVTGQQPFPRIKDSVIIFSAVAGERPGRPPDPNEWVSDNVWNFISRCWSPSLDSRPDVQFAISTLTDAANAVRARHGPLYVTTGDVLQLSLDRVSNLTAQSPQNFMASTAGPEPWEVDLAAFLLAHET